MNKLQRLWPAAAFLLAACASAPTRHVTSPVPAPRSSVDLGADLQQTLNTIVARDLAPASAPKADLAAGESMPIPEHRSIQSALTLFSGEMHDDIQTSLIRSARYRKTIDAALAEYHLPPGLAYLPVIESAYLPSLTSRAGARGIWQFMHETAVEYGLRVDWWIDERADPEKSAHAAAAYLNDLYRDFNDWPLTLAAYNAGAGRIHRALRATGGTTFWDLVDEAAIPRETRGYVPTFYATLLIAMDPDTYGFRLATPADDDTKEVDVEGPLSLAYVADAASSERDLLRELNPSLRRGIVPPGWNRIRVPAAIAEKVAARGATLKDEDANIAVCTFTLRDGDSVKHLARAIGTDVDTILSMNALRSAKQIAEGDSIYLPVRARELGTLLAHYDDPSVYYKVRHGDTVASIARKHGLTIAELRDLNDLRVHQKLHTGQRLRVYKPRPMTAGN